MKIGIELNRRDLLTIIVLSIVFFSLAVWSLGLTRAPVTSWQTAENTVFYIDLGESVNVGTVYLLVKNGSANLQVYIGSPENWSGSRNFVIPNSYYSWSEISVNSITRFVRFDFQPQTCIELAEIAVLSSDRQRTAITEVNGDGFFDPDLCKLIDEQNLVQLPPTYVSETFFDEIYYVRTAEQYLILQVPYEWTHPPLGKLMITTGIVGFGFNPFGWRVMGVIVATLMLPVIYILGKTLFGTWIGGFASAFLLTFDFMHFTMARMATVDTYVVMFSLASQLFFLIYIKNVLNNGWAAPITPLFLAILFFALGFSTKWLVMYGFAAQLTILAMLRLKEVSKLKDRVSDKINAFLDYPYSVVIGFLLVAVLIYFLTYIPDVLAGRTLVEVVGLQGSMYYYHATLDASHAFASPWWTWPLMLKPLWLYVSPLTGNVISTIALMGNPLVWWVGFACIIIMSIVVLFKILISTVRHSDYNLCFSNIFIITFFFFQWVPYMLISRITFIYHFYVNVPFLCLAAAYFISKHWGTKWMKVTAIIYFAGIIALFGLFYPVISGAPASSSWIDGLKWLTGWIF